MELAGWATAGTAAVVGVFTVVGHPFGQVPALSQKTITAIRSVRAVRDEVKASRK